MIRISKYYEKIKCFFADENYHCFFDLESKFRSIWITGFILVTWMRDDFWETIDIAFYSNGSYE